MIKLTCQSTEIGGNHTQQACCLPAGCGKTLHVLKQPLVQGFYSLIPDLQHNTWFD